MEGTEKVTKKGIKTAEDIIREIEQRGTIHVPDNCVTGESFEEWLYEEEKRKTFM